MVLSYLKVHWAISIDWENTQRSPIQGISCVSLQKSTKAKSTQQLHYNWNEKPTLRSAIVKLSSKPRPSRSRWASCVWRKKLIFEFPIYVFHLKSSKVLDHKIVDSDVEIDGDRVGNSKKCCKSQNHWSSLLTGLGQCWSAALQRGQEVGCPSRGYLRRQYFTRMTKQATTCGHLGLEQLEDGSNVLVHRGVPEGHPVPEGGKRKQGQHNPAMSPINMTCTCMTCLNMTWSNMKHESQNPAHTSFSPSA